MAGRHPVGMPSWNDVAAAHPDFVEHCGIPSPSASTPRSRPCAGTAPAWISCTEGAFEDGQVYLGMMAGSLKALDLRRDPRLALHCSTEDTP